MKLSELSDLIKVAIAMHGDCDAFGPAPSGLEPVIGLAVKLKPNGYPAVVVATGPVEGATPIDIAVSRFVEDQNETRWRRENYGYGGGRPRSKP